MKRKQITSAVFKSRNKIALNWEETESNRFYTIADSDYLLQVNDNLQTFDCVTDMERHILSKDMLDNLVDTLLSLNIKFVFVMAVSLYDEDTNFDPVFDSKESTDPTFKSWYLNHKQAVWEDLARLKIVTPAGLITVYPSGVITFPDVSVDTKYEILYNLVLTWNNLLFPMTIDSKTTKFLSTSLK